ncbi:MAG: hypothetical protein JW929_01465 [Anaerolineales bacterium]|nr:hypothetical protein [Anaerolineales bacterium]
MNLTKYPPSLVFALFTLGIDFLLLAFLSGDFPPIHDWDPLLVFGRAALFFYVLHLYLYALAGIAFPAGSGLGTAGLAWVAGLAILYPVCRWYGGWKAGTAADSIWRFF